MTTPPDNENFWSASPADPSPKAGDTPPTPGDESFWDKARPAKPESPKRKRRRWPWVVGVILGSGLLLVGLAPTIASTFGPSLAPGFVPMAGTLEIERMSLSWLGSQSVGPIKLSDPKGGRVANISVTTDAGLFGLITGGLNLGKVTIDGEVDVVRYADGSTNLQAALAQPAGTPKATPSPAGGPGGAGAPFSLPKDLAADLRVAGMRVTVRDEAAGATPLEFSLKDLTLSALVKPGKPLKLSLSTGIEDKAGGKPGSVKLDLEATKVFDESGKLLIDPSRLMENDTTDVELKARLTDVPLALIDAVAGKALERRSLAKGLGSTISATIDADGTPKNLTTTMAAQADGLRANAAFAVAGGSVKTTTPGTVTVTGAALSALLPQVAELTAARKADDPRQVALAAAPDLSLTLSSLALALPTGGKPVDLREASADLAVAVSASSGTLRLQDQTKAFAVAPVEVRLTSSRLRDAARVVVKTSATIDGQAAGAIDTDLTLKGLVDDTGKAGMPAGFEGQLAITGVATAIAQPLLAATGLNLPEDVGPTVDVRLTPRSSQPAAAAGQLPPAEFDVAVRSEKVTVDGALALSDLGLRTIGPGLTIDVASAGQIAGRFIKPEQGLSVSPNGRLRVVVSGLDLVLDAKTRSPVLDQSAALVRTSLESWTVRPTRPGEGAGVAPGEPVQVRALTVDATLAPGQPPTVTARGSMAYEGKPFSLAADVQAPGLIKPGATGGSGIDTSGVQPRGTIEVKDLPTVLARAVFPPASPPAPSTPGVAASPARDLARLIQDGVGPTITLTATGSGSSSTTDVSVVARAANLDADLKAGLTPKAFELRSAEIKSRVSPELVSSFLAQPGAAAADVRLAGPATVAITLDPLSVPRSGLTPDLAGGGVATAKITLAGETLVDGLAVDKDGRREPLGAVGVRDLAATAKLPLKVLAKGGLRGTSDVTATGQLLRGRGAPAGSINIRGTAELADGALAGPLNADASLDGLDVSWADAVLGKPGYATGAIGDRATVRAQLFAEPSNGGTSARAEVSVESPRLNTIRPVRVTVLPDRLSVEPSAEGPAQIAWTLDPAWANANLLAPAPAAPGRPAREATRLTRQTTATLTLSKAVIALGKDAGGADRGPLAPGIFELDARLSIPQVDLAAAQSTTARLTQIDARAQSRDRGVAFDVNVAEAASGDAPPARGMNLRGEVDNLADNRGVLNADAARLTATGELPVVPTALVDVLANQGGLLVDALGPVVNVSVKADRFGKSGGTLDATLRSERATAVLRGDVADGAFRTVAATPVSIDVLEITEALSKRFVSGLPMVASVKKSRTEAPAMVTAANLKAPLDGNIAGLDADIRIDPGELTYTLSPEFSTLISAVNNKPQGVLGRKLQPLEIQMRQGVATYKRWTLPLGEFSVQTEGVVNLVTRELDVVTYIPFGALAEEISGDLKRSLGAAPIAADLLSRAMVPIRTKGTFDRKSTKIDGEAFTKDLLKNLRPEDLIKKGLEDVLKLPGR